MGGELCKQWLYLDFEQPSGLKHKLMEGEQSQSGRLYLMFIAFCLTGISLKFLDFRYKCHSVVWLVYISHLHLNRFQRLLPDFWVTDKGTAKLENHLFLHSCIQPHYMQLLKLSVWFFFFFFFSWKVVILILFLPIGIYLMVM